MGKALDGDVTATSNLTQVTLGVALLRSGVKGRAKITKESPSGPSGKTSNVSPELQKRADAFRKYKEKKNLSKTDKVSSEQFANFKRVMLVKMVRSFMRLRAITNPGS